MKDRLIEFVSSIKKISDINSYDEEATKTTIILNLLSQLGWNIFNRDEVFPEYAVQSKKVDYALRFQNNNMVFIEAKRIKEDLDNHQKQILQYSFQEGVKFAILTNGITWWFYLPLLDKSWEQRKFYTIELFEQEPGEIAEKFIAFLAKENIISGKSYEAAKSIYESKQRIRIIKETLPKAWDKIINDPDEILIALIAETVENKCGSKPSDAIVQNFIKDFVITRQIPIIKRTVRQRKSPVKKEVVKMNNSLSDLEGIEVYHISRKIKASGIITNGGIIVLKGSEASATILPSLRYPELRKEIIKKGILVKNNSKMVFSEDFIFESPSSASGVICGSSRNGRDDWKDSNGNSINDLLTK
ncbi:MAG: DUF4357 domain-containing protein [Candidatus Marinimicrobia bacterium]|nr:DUF4357 domain-containing protein [Candidatus Neomarinimicrobiota bacterium]